MKLIDILKEIHGTSSGMMLNNKPVDIKSIEIDDVDQTDYPDFSDAYISHATYINGMPLSDTELEQLNDQESEFINQKIHDDQLYIQEGEEVVALNLEESKENYYFYYNYNFTKEGYESFATIANETELEELLKE